MRVYTIIGARPQFIKAAVVSRALARAGIEEHLIHTGQHYDPELSGTFFDELGLPAPAVDLGVGSGSHAVQTGAIMTALERYLLDRPKPDWVVVYGDTNSTLAGALVAAKLHLPLAHVEAGLRAMNRRMPEEVNRIVTDRLAGLHCCPTQTAVENLRREGITRGVYLTGDVMLDATRFFAARAGMQVPPEALTPHPPRGYYLATIHRAENTDDPARLRGIFEGLGRLDAPVLLPLHPRTRNRLAGIDVPAGVELQPPVGYLAMLTLVRHARKVITDSGGLQKEAVWLGTPCVTLRDETEWTETLAGGWNRLAGADPAAIVAAVAAAPEGPPPAFGEAPEGRAADRVVAALCATSRQTGFSTPCTS
ncbi:UDP-N-acetylglucosamine 2-epimerase (non-hydrolyzing) [Rhodocaloribacter litoris]|uniref:non-hydrolyzing UDP-N-acetylglucosamine 2-epimerase n=1 Tax=Rhodocaloribacter litoris TaxID=2558931 RepID=UPI00141E97FB|nr:UDP-N-acetylglucosamine 2-epimerase (non-hydrolyzing) [Rhodocaloribacter litoris]QXD15246.1 UDP-N-acetylglucosamine 2-epimerase (non-hydrolyzing) [Rhodocaloribacter litoris]